MVFNSPFRTRFTKSSLLPGTAFHLVLTFFRKTIQFITQSFCKTTIQMSVVEIVEERHDKRVSMIAQQVPVSINALLHGSRQEDVCIDQQEVSGRNALNGQVS